MTRTALTPTITAALAGLAAPALAQTTTLTVNSSQSSVQADICLIPPGLGQRCDNDSSPVAGALDVELDSYTAPTQITLHDFSLNVAQTLTYNFDWGFFFGGVDITISNVVIDDAFPGVPDGPVAVDGAGNFAFPAVAAIIAGQGAYAGYGPILGPLVGSGTFNLADFGVVETAIDASVNVASGTVTLSGAQAFANSGDINGVTVSIDGTASLLAAGPVPACPADFNNDGSVNTVDVIAFLNAWSARHPSADFNHDGTVNTQDVIAFLNAWSAGC